MSSEMLQENANQLPLEIEEEYDNDNQENEEEEEEEEEEGLLDRYNKALDTNPVLTKAITAACVQGLGSILGSLLSTSSSSPASSSKIQVKMVGGAKNQHRSRIDWANVIAFALHGGLINGPIGHYWFEYLSKHGPKSKSYSTLLDQLVVQPPLLVFMFIFLDMTKKALSEMYPSYKRTMEIIGPTIVSSW
eukprot:CAMPEP_0185733712 /NCGR_PEP_ID=MMETSP1171-20130828/20358_1 /TAXON_ID=374046 /ORGANISM="Helicotheca tamensis, Strain CCMP826" /LENGTH=190 /DNA_ID=CAMNT_0028403507 /DNA_START=110 /DNA_END=679 /DNA_ORIENTATION=+